MSHTATEEELDRLDRLYQDWQSTLSELQDAEVTYAARLATKRMYATQEEALYRNYAEAINADIEAEPVRLTA